MMSAETKAKLEAWQSTRPAFVGTVRAEQMPGKAERQTAKARLVRTASGK